MIRRDAHDDDYDGHRFFVGLRNAIYIEAIIVLGIFDLILWWLS